MAGRRRFKSSEDVRRYLGNILNRMDSGELDAQVGSRLAYVCNVLLGSVRVDEVERRIQELEKQMEKKT